MSSLTNNIIIEENSNFKIFRINFESVAYLQEESNNIVYLTLITTDKSSRRKGLAKRLLEYILEYYKDKKIYTIIPESLSPEEIITIQDFFKSNKFIEDTENKLKLWYNLD